jgi:hypothetical protein
MPLKINGYFVTKSVEPFEFKSDNETAKVEIDLQLSVQEKLVRAIKSSRSANLESCYENLNSIQPSNVKPERFSRTI